MAKVIYKYPLETIDVQKISMPFDAEILTIQVQNKVPCIWALVNEYSIKEIRIFEIFGTGNPIPENVNRKYIGTYQLNEGQLVFHCFEFLGLRN